MKKKFKFASFEVLAAVFSKTEQMVEIIFPTHQCVPVHILDSNPLRMFKLDQ